MTGRIWTAQRVYAEGRPIRYVFYSNTGETEQFMGGPVPRTVCLVLEPKDALDLAWSLFEDVRAAAPDLVGAPSVERRHYDLLERTIAGMKSSLDQALEELPRALRTMDAEWKSVERHRPKEPTP